MNIYYCALLALSGVSFANADACRAQGGTWTGCMPGGCQEDEIEIDSKSCAFGLWYSDECCIPDSGGAPDSGGDTGLDGRCYDGFPVCPGLRDDQYCDGQMDCGSHNCDCSIGDTVCDTDVNPCRHDDDDFSGLPPLDMPASIFDVVDCSSVSTLSPGQQEKLSSLGYTKCCTAGPASVLVTGTSDYPDSYLITTCNIIAELVDVDLDGSADNEAVLSGISFERNPLPPVVHGAPTQEQESVGDGLEDGENFAYAFSLQSWHYRDDHDGDVRQVLVEEVFHMMTEFGWGPAYPDLFGSEDFTSSLMCREMASAECVNWLHPENVCQDVGTHEQPPLNGTCAEANCDCVEWFQQVALILSDNVPGWHSNLIPSTKEELRSTLSQEFLNVMDDPFYAMPNKVFTYEYTAHISTLTTGDITAGSTW